MTNLWEMLTKTWLEMEQNSSSTTYNRERVVSAINEVCQAFIQGKIYNHVTDKHISLNIFPENTDKVCYEILESKVTKADITKASTEIEFDTTWLEDSWAIRIDDEIILYTAKESDKITWVTWILSSHKAWAIVNVIFKVPDNLYKPISVYQYNNWNKREVLMKDTINNISTYYTIWLKNNIQYLEFVWIWQTNKVYVDYIKEYELLVDNEDICIFNDNVSLNIIPFIAGWNMIKDEVLRVKLLRQGFGKAIDESTSNWEPNWKPKMITRKRFGFTSVN